MTEENSIFLPGQRVILVNPNDDEDDGHPFVEGSIGVVIERPANAEAQEEESAYCYVDWTGNSHRDVAYPPTQTWCLTYDHEIELYNKPEHGTHNRWTR